MNKTLPDIYAFLLERTARVMKQYSKRRFTEMKAGITIAQWPILKSLSENGPSPQRELARNTFKDEPTVTRIIDLLSKNGFVERLADPTDRRRFLVRLTPKGKKKVKDILPEIVAIRNDGWKGLTQKDFNDLKRILGKIEQNFS